MLVLTGFILAALTILLAVTVFNALTAPLVKQGPTPQSHPRVSVLIPARDEERSIKTCLDSILRQDYPHMEVRVLDDQSTDGTAAIIKTLAQNDSRLYLHRGSPLPAGWTGKNWACHQLAREATGEVLLFTDADNFYAPDAISRTVGWLQTYNLGLFSAFPQQITQTWSEKLVVPVFDHFVYSFLPLWLTYKSRFPSLSAANGQWIAITQNAYQRIGGHTAVKDQIVEDVELCRRAKRQGLKTLTAAGREAVYGRMYRSWQETWTGFSKNAFGLMGFQTIPFFVFMSFLFAVYVLPYGLLAIPSLWPLNGLAVAFNLSIRLILALKYRQNILFSVILHPLSILVTLLIGIHSYHRYRKGHINWKNRAVTMKATEA